jgi:hypothetical protein
MGGRTRACSGRRCAPPLNCQGVRPQEVEWRRATSIPGGCSTSGRLFRVVFRPGHARTNGDASLMPISSEPPGDAQSRCPDVPGISRLSRWSGAPAIETHVISWLVRLQTVTPRVLARPNDGPDHEAASARAAGGCPGCQADPSRARTGPARAPGSAAGAGPRGFRTSNRSSAAVVASTSGPLSSRARLSAPGRCAGKMFAPQP